MASLTPGQHLELDLAKGSLRALAYASSSLAQDALFAHASSDAVAAFESGTQRAVSYAQLTMRARSISARLLMLDPEQAVEMIGVLIERSAMALAVVFGILDFGAAYVPLDTTFSAERVAIVLHAVELIVVQCELIAHVDEWRCSDDGRRVLTVELSEAISDRPFLDGRPKRTRRPVDAVYVMYTSGSSGTPKGVVVPHGALVSRLAWLEAEFKLGPGGRLACRTPYVFGVSEWEVFWPPWAGATALLAPRGAEAEPAAIWRLCIELGATHVFFVASALRDAIAYARERAPQPSKLRHVIQCGEALDAPCCAAFYTLHNHESAPFLTNVYGPTEASMTYWRVPRAVRANEAILVGRPIANTIAIVVDKSRSAPAEVGTVGELWFGGVLACGYVHDDTLTHLKFVDIDIGGIVAEAVALGAVALGERRLYRTGDAAVRTPQGDLRLVGRLDRQVKVAGKRIELGEVENVVHADYPEATLVAAVQAEHDQRIFAFVAGATRVESPKDVNGTPVVVLSVDTIPRLVSGKPDYTALRSRASAHRVDHYVPIRAFASLADFVASTSGRMLRDAGYDSLGLARAYRLVDAERRRDKTISDLARVWAMFGVIIDHWNLDGDAPRIADAQQGQPLLTELIVRSIGNAQSLFLFVCADARDAALRGDHQTSSLGDARDAAALAIYLAMRWPIPSLLCAAFVSPSPCPTCFTMRYMHTLRTLGVDADWDVVAVHRWYLYFGLLARFTARLTARMAGRDATAALAVLSLLVALLAPVSLLVDWNLALSDNPRVRFASFAAFWGGVVAWQGLFSMFALYFAVYAAWYVRSNFDTDCLLSGSARARQQFFVRPAPNHRVAGLLFLSYFTLCCIWTYSHPLHDAIFHASFKTSWGLSATPHRTALSFVVAYSAEFAVNLVLALLFFAAAAAATTCVDQPPVRRLLDLAAENALGTYIAHPYVLHLPAYLAFLGFLRRRFGCYIRIIVLLAFALAFQLTLGPFVHVVLLAIIRAALAFCTLFSHRQRASSNSIPATKNS